MSSMVTGASGLHRGALGVAPLDHGALPVDMTQFGQSLYHAFVDYCQLQSKAATGQQQQQPPPSGWVPKMSLSQLTHLATDLALLAPQGMAWAPGGRVCRPQRSKGRARCTVLCLPRVLDVITREGPIKPQILSAIHSSFKPPGSSFLTFGTFLQVSGALAHVPQCPWHVLFLLVPDVSLRLATVPSCRPWRPSAPRRRCRRMPCLPPSPPSPWR